MNFLEHYWYLLPLLMIVLITGILYLSFRNNLIPYMKDVFTQAAVRKKGIGANSDIIVARQSQVYCVI